MAERTPEDRLREEYFRLLPEARRVMEELEATVRHSLIPLARGLQKYERLVVSSRLKDCESAVGSLRRKEEGGTFDSDRADSYTLGKLKDLAGVRVFAFPRSLWLEANRILRQVFPSWKEAPMPADDGGEEPVLFKYYGYCDASARIRGELQVTPMLVGLFLDIEHSAMYKPSPELARDTPSLKPHKSGVLASLKAFDAAFELLIEDHRRTEQDVELKP